MNGEEDDDGPWITGPVMCAICCHTWTAVRQEPAIPGDDEVLECGHCGHLGPVVYPGEEAESPHG